MKKHFFKWMICAIALLTAASITACGNSGKQNSTPAGSAESQMAETAVDEELAKLIDNAGTVGEGTAGSSLKKAKIAHDLAELAAEKGYTEKDIDKLKSTFEASLDSMNEDAKSSVHSVFTNGVFPMLDKAITDGSFGDYKGLLEDAGVDGDLDTVLKTPGLEDSYNSIKSAYLALETSQN
jgi:hypothetical protein